MATGITRTMTRKSVLLLVIGVASVVAGRSQAQVNPWNPSGAPPPSYAPPPPPPTSYPPSPPPGSPPPPARLPEPEMRWYGWQMLIVDAVVSGVIAYALVKEDRRLGTSAVIGYLAGGPMIQAAHGQPRRVLRSVGARIANPLVFGLIGVAVGQCGRDGESHCRSWALGGLLFGMGLGILYDQAEQSMEPKPVTLTLAPAWGGGGGGAVGGLALWF
jgi:hypothetical protein